MSGIKTFRKREKLTQAELAELLGVNSRTVRSWESGDSHPGKKMARIAAVLNTTEVEIVAASAQEPSTA